MPSNQQKSQLGTEPVSGLNGLNTPESVRGEFRTDNAQREAREQMRTVATTESEAASALQTSLGDWQRTLKAGWTSVANSVKTASPRTLVIGGAAAAAAIGAAVWLGSRNRRSDSTDETTASTAGRRWSPSGSLAGQPDLSRSNRETETWQRPTAERWDD